jgi:uncharacterized membrane protein
VSGRSDPRIRRTHRQQEHTGSPEVAPAGTPRARTLRPAIAIVAIALAGVAISTYLAATELAGGLPVCGPIQGCRTVATSAYADLAGLPVAVLGVGFSGVIATLGAVWGRTTWRPALMALYGLGLFGVLSVGFLTYLEIAVIQAICIWCIGYAVTVLGGWLVAAVALTRR